MRDNKIKPRENLQKKIFESLGYDKLQDLPGLLRTRQEIKTDDISETLNEIADKSQKKRKRVKQVLSNYNSKGGSEQSDQMKELEWRLQVLRNDKKQLQKNSGEPMTFEEMYKRQKNKYMKFRDRQKIKINDPKYLQMIGSMQMRRQKRKLQSLEKIERSIQNLDSNIKNHTK